MAVKKLIDAVVFGFGASAGQKLLSELEEKLIGKEEKPPPPETADEKAKRVKVEAKLAEKAAKARAKDKARTEAEVDKELAAMKKRLKKS